jgi:uncharacterized protein (TIGR01244 family)
MSIDITKHSDEFSACGQVTVDDIASIAALGFKTIINNRPDMEGGPEQPTSDAIKAQVEQLGLTYVYLPIIPNNIQASEVAAFAKAVAEAPKPILGFCRTGNRVGKILGLSQAA